MIAICHYLGFLCERNMQIRSQPESQESPEEKFMPTTNPGMTFEQCSSECDKIGSGIFDKNDVENMQRDNFIISILIITKY